MLDNLTPTQVAWVFIVSGYLSGCFMSAYYLPLWIKGIDVTAGTDDGNPGVANALARAGWPLGLLSLACDLLKGFIPIRLALGIMPLDSPWLAAVLVAPALGHAFPVFRHFRGGKAIAVSFGTLLGLLPTWQPLFWLAFYYVVFSVVLVVSPDKFKSILTFALWVVTVDLTMPWRAIRVGCTMIGTLVVYKHAVAPDAASDGAKASFRLFRRA